MVSHDRWLLDTVCERTWEVDRGQVHAAEGGYSAYVLAEAERERSEEAAERRRRNLARKELAWLQRGARARTTKAKFRVEAANALIAAEPPPRDSVELTRLATARLGKTVIELEDVSLAVRAGAGPAPAAGARDLAARPGRPGGDRRGQRQRQDLPAQRLAGRAACRAAPPTGRSSGARPCGWPTCPRTWPSSTPTSGSARPSRRSGCGSGSATASFPRASCWSGSASRAERQWTRIGDLSGGERRRVQMLRLLMDEPNVLLLDEPTNDLDIETLTEFEDLLDGWPGTLVVVSHDRYFLERVTEHVVALLGDGRLSFLGGGVDEYLDRIRAARPPARRVQRGPDRAGRGRAPGAGGRAEVIGGRGAERPQGTRTAGAPAGPAVGPGDRTDRPSWPRTPPTTRN